MHTSGAWGGLQDRNALFSKILNVFPTSEKLSLRLKAAVYKFSESDSIRKLNRTTIMLHYIYIVI
jgi:hypothetical protein